MKAQNVQMFGTLEIATQDTYITMKVDNVQMFGSLETATQDTYITSDESTKCSDVWNT